MIIFSLLEVQEHSNQYYTQKGNHLKTQKSVDQPLKLYPKQKLHRLFSQAIAEDQPNLYNKEKIYRLNDKIQKSMWNVFRNAAMEFFQMDLPPIVKTLNVEFQDHHWRERRADLAFELEDGRILHIEFQTDHDEEDNFRFYHYNHLLHVKREMRDVITTVIYSADVKNKVNLDYNFGSTSFSPKVVMMYTYNGNEILENLEQKVFSGMDLTDKEMVALAFIPLTNNAIIKLDLAFTSLHLADSIKDPEKRRECVNAIFGFSEKYLSATEYQELKGEFEVTNVFIEMEKEIIQKAEQRALKMGREEGREEGIVETAKNFLKSGFSVDVVAKNTKLSVTTVEKLQSTL